MGILGGLRRLPHRRDEPLQHRLGVAPGQADPQAGLAVGHGRRADGRDEEAAVAETGRQFDGPFGGPTMIGMIWLAERPTFQPCPASASAERVRPGRAVRGGDAAPPRRCPGRRAAAAATAAGPAVE